MGFLYRFVQNLPWRSHQVSQDRQARPQPGISEGGESFPATIQEPLVKWPLDLDIGEVAPGYHLIVLGVSLFDKDLLFESAFSPELTEEAHGEVWLNMRYDADVPPSNLNYMGAGGDVQYERPPLDARYAWFDFFRPDYEWNGHFDHRGQLDSDYLRNRIARLTVDLRTGEAQIER